MKALITYPYKDEELENFKALGYDIIFEKDEKNLKFTPDMRNIDVMVTFNPFDNIDIGMFPNLKWIQLLSAGVNQIPVDKVLEQNIIITNSKGCYSIPMAEWIVAKVLEMCKNSQDFYQKQIKGLWKKDTSMLELYGKTIGFIGTGSIAQEAAKRLKAFGTNIIGINASGKKSKYFDECFKVEKICHLVSQCDIIIIAAPYTDDTHHLIDQSVLNSMKNGSYLVNIARGNIINEEALIHNLRLGKVAKAALDVFETEPLPMDSPLWNMKNVIISPHNSWASEVHGRRRYMMTYENMKRYINSEDLINIIDIKKGY